MVNGFMRILLCQVTLSSYRYRKKYFGSRLEQGDTGPWRKMRDREKLEEERERFTIIIEIFVKMWQFHMHRRKKMSRDKRGFKRVAGQLITGNKVRDLWVNEFKFS